MLETLKFTTSKSRAGDNHILGVLQVNSICVGAVTRRRSAEVGNLDACASIKFEVGLRAVLYSYTSHCYTITSIES